MAKDESIFASYAHKNISTLRIYGWERPCVSLGYFQKADEALFLDNSSEAKIPFVRRMTGGAAILHGDEITYSLTLCCGDLGLDGSVKASYKKLTSFLLNFYNDLGVKAGYAFSEPVCPKDGELSRSHRHFCFSSREQFDIIIKGKKIGGNAQKRRKKNIFQHGSIPLSVDFDLAQRVIKDVPPDIAKKTQGLEFLIKEKCDRDGLIKKLVTGFLNTFGVDAEYGALDEDEERLMQNLIKDKYSVIEWNARYAKTRLA